MKQDSVQKVQVVVAGVHVQDNAVMVIKIVREEETVATVDLEAKIVNNANIIVIVVNVKTNKKVINKKTIKRNIKRTDLDQKKEMIVKFFERTFGDRKNFL